MTSVEERLKLKRGQVDPWSTREKLCLASSVVKNGNQNWMSVSRSLRGFGGEPGRPGDWFSQKSCAVQYDNLLTQIETPKRKKRGADGSKSEGPDLTPAQAIVKQLTVERIEELRKSMAEAREIFMREKEEISLVQNGLADERLDEMLAQIQEEKRQKEAEHERNQQWLKQREERKHEMEMAWRPHAAQQLVRGPRRPSNQSELGSETDTLESPSSSEQLTANDETAESKPASTPTSPLLTSLLKSPSPVTGSQSSSILHSAITSQRGASPTITSLLNSSPGVPSSNTSIPQSPNLKSLVSNTLGGHDDVPKTQPHSTSSSPTLSMLLELPPSTPGKLPELPQSATKPASSSPKPGDGKEISTVEQHLEVQSSNPSEQAQTLVEFVPEVEVPGWCRPIAETVTELDDVSTDQKLAVVPIGEAVDASLQHQPAVDFLPLEDSKLTGQIHLPIELPEIAKCLYVEQCSVDLELPKVSPAKQKERSVKPVLENKNCVQQDISPSLPNATLALDDCLLLEQCHSAHLLEVGSSEFRNYYDPTVESKSDIENLEDRNDNQINGSPLSTVEDCCPTRNSTANTLPEPSQQKNLCTESIERLPENSVLVSEGVSSVPKQSRLSYALVPKEDCSSLDSDQFEALMSQFNDKSQEKAVNILLGRNLSISREQTEVSVTSDTFPPEAGNRDSSENSTSLVLQRLTVTPQEVHTQDIDPKPAQNRESSGELLLTACSRVKTGETVDSVKKEPVPDSSNIEIVLPVDAGVKVSDSESKVSLDAADLQQISSDELEYVVDPSIDVVLQEFVPEGLVDEMAVYIVNSDDVDTDVSNILDGTETNDTIVPEQVESKLDSELNQSISEVPSTVQKIEKGEVEPVSVMVHSSPVHQSPQRVNVTPSSVVTSPRSAGRPSKGNMVARKIVMEEEEASEKSDVLSSSESAQQMAQDTETLSREALENASVLFVQENGQLVKLSESGQATSIIDDLHLIQDTSENSVVVVHHEDIAKDSELDAHESSHSSSEDINESCVNVPIDSTKTVNTDLSVQGSVLKSPSIPPRKLSDKKELHDASPAKIVESGRVSEEGAQIKLKENFEAEEEKVSQSKDEVQFKEPKAEERLIPSVEEPKEVKVLDPLKEGPTRKKSLTLSKREKSPITNQSSNENAVDENGSVVKVGEDLSKSLEEQPVEKVVLKERSGSAILPAAGEEESQNADSEVVITKVKEEKLNRAETPSTEDDNTIDVDPPPPAKRGRGRHTRENTSYPDSVPNSPASTSLGPEEEKDHKAWKKSIMLVYDRIAQHKNASIFFKPITDDIAPNYSSMIRCPQDLQTIKKRIETGETRTTDEFQRDILLMFYNAIMYNKTDTPVHDMAREMQEEGVALLNEYRNTQMLVHTGGAEVGHLPSRRGTRTADKRDQDLDSFVSRRGPASRSNPTRTGAYSTGLLGKRKRSLPDDKITPKRRKDDD